MAAIAVLSAQHMTCTSLLVGPYMDNPHRPALQLAHNHRRIRSGAQCAANTDGRWGLRLATWPAQLANDRSASWQLPAQPRQQRLTIRCSSAVGIEAPTPENPGAGKLRPLRVIVAGGGIAGLTAARALLDAGLEVSVYERRELDDMLSGPGGIYVLHNALRPLGLLKEGQLLDALYEAGGRVMCGGFFDTQGKRLFLSEASSSGNNYGGLALFRPELMQILHSSLPPETVTVGNGVVSFEEKAGGGVSVTLQDGSVQTCDILVGADGANSLVRAKLEGKERMERGNYAGCVCWRGLFHAVDVPSLADAIRIPGELGEKYGSYTWFEMQGVGRRLGAFHVGKDRWTIYVFATREPLGTGRTAPYVGAKQELLELFKDFAPVATDIIRVMDESMIFAADVVDREPIDVATTGGWAKGSVTIIGDAAHLIVPTLGQGGAMGIEDAFELAKALRNVQVKATERLSASADVAATVSDDGTLPGGASTAIKAEEIAATLRAFECERSARTTKVFEASRDFGKLCDSTSPFVAFLRNVLFEWIPPKMMDSQFQFLFEYRPKW